MLLSDQFYFTMKQIETDLDKFHAQLEDSNPPSGIKSIQLIKDRRYIGIKYCILPTTKL